jgi:hypothetical protein
LGRVLLFLGLLLLLDLVGATFITVFQVRSAANSLEGSLLALRRDDVTAATLEIADARASAAAARDLVGHPGFRLLRALPLVGDDADGLETLVSVVELSSAAGTRLVDGLDAIGAREGGIFKALYSGGRVNLDGLERLGDVGTDAGESIDAARAILDDRPVVHLGLLTRSLEQAQRRLATLDEVIAHGSMVARVLPGMVGQDGPRRYLLAFQSPSEARGGGGLIGVFGILSASDGRVRLDEVSPIEDLGPRVHPPVTAPHSYEELYGRSSALKDWRQANMSPNFPSTSRVLLDMYERVRNERLDGVIAMDPMALGELTRGTGGLKAAGWHKTITRNNARRILLFRIYKHFVNREKVQNLYLRSLVDELWARVGSGDVDVAKLISGFDESIAKQHLKIYSADTAEQSLLAKLDVTADPSSVVGPLQSIYNNNSVGNKLDFFLRREQSVDITLDADGTAHVRSAITLTNDVPTKGLRAAGRSGIRDGLALGVNRMALYFMLPKGSRLARYEIDGQKVFAFRGRDDGFPVAWQLLQMDPEATAEAIVTYTLPDAIDPDGMFSFTLWPQTTARPDSYSLTVTAPASRSFVSSDGPKRGISVTGSLKTPRTVSLSLVDDH